MLSEEEAAENAAHAMRGVELAWVSKMAQIMAGEAPMFSTPMELQKFAAAAKLITLATMSGDAPAMRALLSYAGFHDIAARLLDKGMEGAGRFVSVVKQANLSMDRPTMEVLREVFVVDL